MDLMLVIAGFAILLVAGDVLVRGAVGLSLRLGIPAFIVSLTVVAFGTSAPELLIVLQAVFDGAPDLAMGNIIGSNIANILLVLGIPALLFGIDTKGSDCIANYRQMIVATVIFIALAFIGPLGVWHGVILLTILAYILFQAIRITMASSKAQAEAAADLPQTDGPFWKTIVFLLVGLVWLPIGAGLLIEGAVNIATELGVDQAVIGLTLVAIGTSLPELATTVMAAMRRQTDVLLGNVIGSNMFNLLAILGIASFFGPIPVAPEFLRLDLWLMAAASLAIAPFVVWKLQMGRLWGAVFCASYVTYVVALLA